LKDQKRQTYKFNDILRLLETEYPNSKTTSSAVSSYDMVTPCIYPLISASLPLLSLSLEIIKHLGKLLILHDCSTTDA
jgi:hypothetical protein